MRKPNLQTDYGIGCSIKGLGNYMSDWAKGAGLSEGKSFHGPRKLVGSRLAEAGCSEKEIIAVLGQSPLEKHPFRPPLRTKKKRERGYEEGPHTRGSVEKV